MQRQIGKIEHGKQQIAAIASASHTCCRCCVFSRIPAVSRWALNQPAGDGAGPNGDPDIFEESG
ncbi:MAG: hypothetical protein WCI67_17285 [Chloroflexales bacterium]